MPKGQFERIKDKVVNCRFCGNEYVTWRNGYNYYCSPSCKYKARKVRDGGVRKSPVWRKYGLTDEEFHALVQAQDNRCAICKIEFGNDEQRKRCVDHDHSTGKVRGLLCRACNTALHRLITAGTLREAIVYLEKTAEDEET